MFIASGDSVPTMVPLLTSIPFEVRDIKWIKLALDMFSVASPATVFQTCLISSN